MDNESIDTAKVSFIYTLKSKTNMVCLFFFSIARAILLINKFVLHGRKTAGFLHELEMSFNFEGKKKYVIQRPGSARMGKNCTLGQDLAAGKYHICITEANRSYRKDGAQLIGDR